MVWIGNPDSVRVLRSVAQPNVTEPTQGHGDAMMQDYSLSGLGRARVSTRRVNQSIPILGPFDEESNSDTSDSSNTESESDNSSSTTFFVSSSEEIRKSCSDHRLSKNLGCAEEESNFSSWLADLHEKRRLYPVNSASGLSQCDLRDAIKKINGSANLSIQEKSMHIQDLMSFSWKESRSRQFTSQKLSTKSEEGCKVPVEAHAHELCAHSLQGNACGSEFSDPEFFDEERNSLKITTWYDEKLGIRGCKHYQRSCHVAAPCCDKFFCCRFCHNESSDHEIERSEINRVRCMICAHVQGVQGACEECGANFGKYFCEKCRFFDDDHTKHIYHCDKCKICRIGEGLGIDFFHCDRCNACMSISQKDHRCIERSLESDCPVCNEYLFTSTIPVMFLPCGHCIHVSCYEEYTMVNFVCPVCCKSLGDMSHYFRRVDAMLENEEMPEEYRHMKNIIFCCDCECRSTAPFHFLYHKCLECEGYNTRVIETISN